MWEIVYSKDGSVKEVLKVMQLKGHKVRDTYCFVFSLCGPFLQTYMSNAEVVPAKLKF